MTTKTESKQLVFAPRWKHLTVTIKGEAPLAMQNRP